MTTQETGHRQEPVKTDVLIIGGGIAGASVG